MTLRESADQRLPVPGGLHVHGGRCPPAGALHAGAGQRARRQVGAAQVGVPLRTVLRRSVPLRSAPARETTRGGGGQGLLIATRSNTL